MGCLAYSVSMLYLFLSIDIFQFYDDIFSFLNRWEWMKRWCEFLILSMFLLGHILLYVVMIFMVFTKIGQLPIIPCLLAAKLFFISIILWALHNEADCQIREKNDPNFRRCRGFS
jgi:hypothetical protein